MNSREEKKKRRRGGEEEGGWSRRLNRRWLSHSILSLTVGVRREEKRKEKGKEGGEEEKEEEEWEGISLHPSRSAADQGLRCQRSLEVWKMGIVNYLETLGLQEKLVSDRKLGKIPDTILSLQHPATYTLRKRRTYHNLLVPEVDLQTIVAELHYTQRGGDVTFHGPHQAILYPIISLRDIKLGARKYVENLELTMIELASVYGVQAHAGRMGKTGVWVGDRKIGAIGVQISSGFTSHGLVFNIDPDLNYFNHIVPCGIADKGTTSLKRERHGASC